MPKSQNKFIKKQRANEKKKQREEKLQKQRDKKSNKSSGKLEDMMAYVDSDGNIRNKSSNNLDNNLTE